MTLRLFEGYGIEIEYMIVDAATLAVRPIADVLLRHAAGAYATEVEMGALDWSNELTLHLVELKTHGPARALEGLGAAFAADVAKIDAMLAPLGARLMPTAMHPSMDPHAEMRLWPHDNNPVYEAYHRIFDCRGHGWANLQSVHLNLPFAGDDELWALHSAARLLLPLVPGLAGSSPLVEGERTGKLCNRVAFYESHVARVPSLIGDVIPEVARSRDEYEAHILAPIYADLAPLDPAGTLREEWSNARGAIARFDRMAVELRLTDVQEHPEADIAVAALIAAAAQHLIAHGDRARMDALSSARLRAHLVQSAEAGDEAVIDDPDYLRALGLSATSMRTGDVWRALYDLALPAGGASRAAHAGPLEHIFETGVLGRRIARAVGSAPSPARVHAVYGALCDCLREGRAFVPDDPRLC